MIDFSKKEETNKISFNTPITIGAKPVAHPIEENPELTREIIEEEKAFRRGVLSVRDIIAPASLKVEANHLLLGDKFLRTIFIIAYPRYITVGWFAPIINLNVTFDVSMFFYPVESAIILKQLKNKVGALGSADYCPTRKRARRAIRCGKPPCAILKICAMRLTQGTEKFFQFALYVTIYADNKEELDQINRSNRRYFRFAAGLFQTSFLSGRAGL